MADKLEQDRAAREVLWYYEPSAPGAWEPGGFHKSLLTAMVRADVMNLARLSMSFPELARWVYSVKFTKEGLEELKTQVKSLDEEKVEQ